MVIHDVEGVENVEGEGFGLNKGEFQKFMKGVFGGSVVQRVGNLEIIKMKAYINMIMSVSHFLKYGGRQSIE